MKRKGGDWKVKRKGKKENVMGRTRWLGREVEGQRESERKGKRGGEG